MVYKKISNFGLNLYEAPIIPKARRSIRKNQRKRVVEDKESPCPFELLAAVAGKLWEDSEGSASCSAAAEGKSKLHDRNETELLRDDMVLKSDSFDRSSYAESVFAPEISSKEHNILSNSKGLLEFNPSIDTPKNVECGTPNITCKGISHTSIGEPLNVRVEYGSEVLSRDEKYKDPFGICVNTNSLVASESSVKLPLYRKWTPHALVQKHRDNVKLGLRDDDENSIGCNEYSTGIGPFKPQRRMRKMLMSRYLKAAVKRKGYNLCTFSEGTKAFYGYRKSLYARYQQAKNKKRKLFDHSFSAKYDCAGKTSNIISNAPGEAANGISAYTQTNSKPKEQHVTLNIKSFKVPELYLEIPENATVSLLKRTVLEEVTAILRGEIRVGIFLQGKKVRGDKRTLQQAGISQCSNLDFALEPNHTQMTCVKPNEYPASFTCDADRKTPRSLIDPLGNSNGIVEPQHVIKLDAKDSMEIVPFPVSKEHGIPNGDEYQTLALVPVLAEVQKLSKCTEVSQRRTRRPFSVAEVEALVQGVENLGTGRWRDVKMHAFENADHRTYVDLKDKWKTLVHTASISPQQRRGEPVPHELLDRVLAAHSYWSKNPSKQHIKAQKPLNIVA